MDTCLLLLLFLLFSYILAMLHGIWDFSFPTRGWNPHLLHEQHGVLTPGPPGRSLLFLFFLLRSPGPEQNDYTEVVLL